MGFHMARSDPWVKKPGVNLQIFRFVFITLPPNEVLMGWQSRMRICILGNYQPLNLVILLPIIFFCWVKQLDKTYSWFCTQGPLLLYLKEYLACQGPNWVNVVQDMCSTYYTVALNQHYNFFPLGHTWQPLGLPNYIHSMS